MEASSPLAAIHRPQFNDFWSRRDPPLPPYRAIPRASGVFGTGYRLREHLQKSKPDFRSDVRGSSPAATLAADLSQNFHLDNDSSPRFATPRRNLFSATAIMGAESRDYTATPSIPSSSPVPLHDAMDVSPMLGRAPHLNHVEEFSPLESRAPILSVAETGIEQDYGSNNDLDEDDQMILESPARISRRSSFEAPKPHAPERFRPIRRTSISRMKGYGLANHRGVDNQLPPFQFGVNSGRLARANSAASLGEAFEPSPASQDNRPQTANSPSANSSTLARCRPQMPPLVSLTTKAGSPVNCHMRRTSNPFNRSRRHFRRTLSMFEHPEDVMRSKTTAPAQPCTTLESVVDVEEAPELTLPHFSSADEGDTIPRISQQTLVDVLDGKFSCSFDHKIIIDCRFEYEYEGGHIDGAVNYNNKELLTTHLFGQPLVGRVLIVFHCEYSAHRAPMMARHIRSVDRTVNVDRYPQLTYPEVYILDGGYSEFFTCQRSRCYPQNYVEMSDEKHQRTCERELGRLKTRKAPSLSRAKTYAFGSDSPIASRGGIASLESPSISFSMSPPRPDPFSSRRFVSF